MVPVPGLQISVRLGCSSGFVGEVAAAAAAAAAVLARNRGGIARERSIRSLAGRHGSRAQGWRVGVGRWLCRLLGLRLGHRSEAGAAVLVVVLCSAIAAAGRNSMVS